MPYITLPDSMPGMRGLLAAFPETGYYLSALAEYLLRDSHSSLTPAERELIAARISQGNACTYCTRTHGETARKLFPEGQGTIVDEVIYKNNNQVLSEKMLALIELALAVQKNGLFVEQFHIDRVRSAGADDKTIHDTVLIAAAFCMFNRYVDGLRAWTPEDRDTYIQIGSRLAEKGYISDIQKPA